MKSRKVFAPKAETPAAQDPQDPQDLPARSSLGSRVGGVLGGTVALAMVAAILVGLVLLLNEYMPRTEVAFDQAKKLIPVEYPDAAELRVERYANRGADYQMWWELADGSTCFAEFNDSVRKIVAGPLCDPGR